ncbi:lipoate--protein ligase family protein [Leptospira sp. GIMC2001]|uniref:lipoate--protein ligase family protein n=1 Tax=Leptospira sp. GIMC2001 TaxID=1513297 RepID=UPI002349151F|nr:lipoate--protein ligase family protein [Leptospira sp. GIMC2001]WCL48678.1 lipoate--protein ligase family protein [Leptospira sp. GIMC2001]
MSIFLFQQKSIPNPYFQLALEEAIALNLSDSDYTAGIRIWRNIKSIVLGISEKESLTIKKETLETFRQYFKDDLYKDLTNKNTNFQKRNNLRLRKENTKQSNTLSLVRRASGGGTVYQDWPGNLNFSLFVNTNVKKELYPVQNSYDILLGIAIKALGKQGYQLVSAGKSDLSVQDSSGNLKKISGNAQFRKKNTIVQHGTLILSPTLFEEVEKYQLHPPEEPNYRNKRSHKDFLTHLDMGVDEDKLGADLAIELANYMDSENHSTHAESTARKFSIQKSFLNSCIQRAYTLAKSKYLTEDWLFRG